MISVHFFRNAKIIPCVSVLESPVWLVGELVIPKTHINGKPVDVGDLMVKGHEKLSIDVNSL